MSYELEMEVVAVASSIAGLFSLAGQCISGAQTLRALYSDIVDTSKTVKSFSKDVNDLLRTLTDVRLLLEKIQDQDSLLTDELLFTTLRLQLEDCDTEIGTWIRTAEKAKAAGGKGTRGWFKKFWMALDKDSTNSVRADMQKRRLEIAVALSTLGRYKMFLRSHLRLSDKLTIYSKGVSIYGWRRQPRKSKTELTKPRPPPILFST